MILRAAAAKNAGKIERLFVIGCLSERYADSLRAELPEVDGFFGARTWDGIAGRWEPPKTRPWPPNGTSRRPGTMPT